MIVLLSSYCSSHSDLSSNRFEEVAGIVFPKNLVSLCVVFFFILHVRSREISLISAFVASAVTSVATASNASSFARPTIRCSRIYRLYTQTRCPARTVQATKRLSRVLLAVSTCASSQVWRAVLHIPFVEVPNVVCAVLCEQISITPSLTLAAASHRSRQAHKVGSSFFRDGVDFLWR